MNDEQQPYDHAPQAFTRIYVERNVVLDDGRPHGMAAEYIFEDAPVGDDLLASLGQVVTLLDQRTAEGLDEHYGPDAAMEHLDRVAAVRERWKRELS